MLKEKLIEESIRCLREEGLRFSVDSLAKRLKVSKKTIYQYFPSKEALAYALYEKYYGDMAQVVQKHLEQKAADLPILLLRCYYDAACMVRGEIFNKYCLNGAVGEFALQRHAALWEKIAPQLCGSMTADEAKACRLIVDGAFDRAITQHADPDAVIAVLRRLV
ncbi:MAG: TetR/AcrR family transcriptional regulator [Faecousia sp.]